MFIRDGPAGQTVVFDEAEPPQQAFGPGYAADASPGIGPWVWHAELSDDLRTLSIEFFGVASPDDRCGRVAYEPWVGRDGDQLLVKVVSVPAARLPVVPSPTPAEFGGVFGCISYGIPHVYQLALPEPFTGTTVRDLNGWRVDLSP